MAEQLVVGQEFEGRTRRVSQARIFAFSGGPLETPGWPARNLHTDEAKAAEAGLRAPIASGVQCEGDIIRLLLELFGDAWFAHGRLSVKYPRPVFAGELVRPRAKVRSTRPGDRGTVVELDVSCETAEKATVVVGTASCLITRELGG